MLLITNMYLLKDEHYLRLRDSHGSKLDSKHTRIYPAPAEDILPSYPSLADQGETLTKCI